MRQQRCEQGRGRERGSRRVGSQVEGRGSRAEGEAGQQVRGEAEEEARKGRRARKSCSDGASKREKEREKESEGQKGRRGDSLLSDTGFQEQRVIRPDKEADTLGGPTRSLAFSLTCLLSVAFLIRFSRSPLACSRCAPTGGGRSAGGGSSQKEKYSCLHPRLHRPPLPPSCCCP